MEFTPEHISSLAHMLKPPDEDSDSDCELDQRPTSYGKMGPGEIGPSTQKNQKSEKVPESKGNPKDIWGDDEVPEGSEFDTTFDPRPQPEYDIVFKQAVSSEDMFLQMGNKTPSTASCEDMVIKIKLPDTKAADLTLDVKTKFLDLRTPKYKLGLHLPHPVNHKTGKAQWDGDKNILNVTLRMQREYDFINF
ncbi:dynein axonemal assembly factor 6-like [Crassostrea angulata]|uniref:dynein axonemal assembly factor 6-like n=1 Tax=Magallana angulata TaxID=2784310 RepID=UPI0022B0C113|nr:dynein axonemal assembly factor 6-like [Crassostrea angulata]